MVQVKSSVNLTTKRATSIESVGLMTAVFRVDISSKRRKKLYDAWQMGLYKFLRDSSNDTYLDVVVSSRVP